MTAPVSLEGLEQKWRKDASIHAEISNGKVGYDIGLHDALKTCADELATLLAARD